MTTQVTVSFGEKSYELAAGETLTFGRSPDCTICLDPDDAAISRCAGALVFEGQTWWLVNRSSVRPLSVIDDLGLRSVLAPGRRIAIEHPVRVVVDGTNGKHRLAIDAEAVEVSMRTNEVLRGEPTATDERVLISPADRLAMVALFAGYLEDGPRHDPHPRTYEAAAARLGWPKTTLIKRIEYLRTRLDKAGVPNMTGPYALVNLAEYVISRGLITRADLQLLRRPTTK
ncbi:MAG TPA: hypothetical protein VIL34_23985 [Actinopolymorphaceae bacterium]|jgi:hypothetical protein